MNRLLVAATFTALTLTTASATARDRTAIPEATPDGPAVSCLRLTNIRETRIHGDSTIDFFTNGGKVYRNTLPLSCPSLGFEERYLYKTSTNDICSVDFITVLQSPGLTPGPSCGLGKFQPVKIVKAPAN